MATFEVRKVAKPFHLTLEEYKKLFPDFRARGNKLIVVAISPVSNLSIAMDRSKAEQDKVAQALSKRGHIVLSVGSQVKEDFKEGDLVFLPSLSVCSFAMGREIIIKDVFPRVRNYTMAVVDASYIEADVLHPVDEIVEIELSVNISMEKENYEKAIKTIEEKDQNVNKFKDN